MALKRHKPTAVDLFAGCGGLTEGLKQAGFKVIGAVEIDPVAVQTFKANHRRVTVWNCDIRELTVGKVKETLGLRRGELDLLAGCPPCQGFSALRTLNGSRVVDDPRNDLVEEFVRFVRELHPKTILMENVPALEGDARFEAFLRSLGNLGYCHEHRILNAAEYGVPQRRERLLLLAGHKMPIRFAKPIKRRRLVRHAIGRLPVSGIRVTLYTTYRRGDRSESKPSSLGFPMTAEAAEILERITNSLAINGAMASRISMGECLGATSHLH